MSRSRLISLSLLVAFVVGAVATASASEPPKKCGGTVSAVPAYCVQGLQLENSKGEAASEKVEGTSGEAILAATIASATTEVKCEKGKSKGTIEDGISGTIGKSAVTMTFEKCKLVKPADCKLSEADEKEIKTSSLAGELILTSGRVEDKLEPKSGSFAVIGIEGENSSCVITHVGEEEVVSVTGSQRCEVDKSNTEAEKETEKHKLICKTSGSGLKVGGNGAEMADEATVALSGTKAHDAWSIKEHT